MLTRRHVLGLLATLLLPRLTQAEKIEKSNFLTDHAVKDLPRLKMSHHLRDGRIVESKIDWICEYYIRGTRYIYVSTRSLFPKNCLVKETVFVLDGQVIGKTKGGKDVLDPGEHQWCCCHGQHVGHDQAPALWFINCGPKQAAEASDFLGQMRAHARIAEAA